MDLATVLADGTDGLGHAALARYFRDIFTSYLPPEAYPGAFRVRAALNVGVQQLATRSRVDPQGQGYLQIGGFDPTDLPAALIEAMPHTPVAHDATPDGTAAALAALRARLPADGMPHAIRHGRSGRFGLICVFDDAAAPSELAPLLGTNGRVLAIGRAHAGAQPLLSLHDA